MSASLVITARFPLGTFLGHRADGTPAPLPDTARLHGALTNAAGQATTAEEDGPQLRPAAEAVAALRWLEENPPDALSLPASEPVAINRRGRPTLAWRNEGVMESATKPSSRRVAKRQSDGIALAGVIGWGWTVPVPDSVRVTLDQLCADVSCLGEADSPVVLELPEPSGWEPTHLLDPAETAFPAPGGLAVRTPMTGRFDELERDYRKANPSKLPTVAADRWSWTANPSAPTPNAAHVRERIYRVPERAAEAPWRHALTIPVVGDAHPSDAVTWCVAFHRALATRMGAEAPPVITGWYGELARPANRVAIHLVHPLAARADRATRPTFVVLLPKGITPDELAVLQRALGGLRRVHCRHGDVSIGKPTLLDADAFWRPPRAGELRRWRPMPALVPEVRRQRGKGWGLEQAVAVSVGNLLRDRFDPIVSGGEGHYRRLAQAALDHGVRTFELRVLRESDVARYVHKTHRDLVVQPITGLVDVGSLVGPSTLFALGQSRHLGGGLMIPEDTPIAYAEVRGIA